MFISSAVMASLYFGGYHFPFENELMQLTGEFWIRIIGAALFLGKVVGLILFFMWVRWSIPRFRYDQLMNLGWKTLLPLSIANVVITGLVVAVKEGWFNVYFQ